MGETGEWGRVGLSVYYETGQDQGLIRNKWVVQNKSVIPRSKPTHYGVHT